MKIANDMSLGSDSAQFDTLQGVIGGAAKAVEAAYRPVVAEEIPSHLLTLLAKLDGRRGKGEQRNTTQRG